MAPTALRVPFDQRMSAQPSGVTRWGTAEPPRSSVQKPSIVPAKAADGAISRYSDMLLHPTESLRKWMHGASIHYFLPGGFAGGVPAVQETRRGSDGAVEGRTASGGDRPGVEFDRDYR